MKKKTKKVVISLVLCVTLLLTMAVSASAWVINENTGRFASSPRTTTYNTKQVYDEVGNCKYLSLANCVWTYSGPDYYNKYHTWMREWAKDTIMRVDINSAYGGIYTCSFMLRYLDFAHGDGNANAMGILSFASDFYYYKQVYVPIEGGNGAEQAVTVDGWAQIQFVLNYTFGQNSFYITFSDNSAIVPLEDTEAFNLVFGDADYKPYMTIYFQPELNAYQDVVVNGVISDLKDNQLELQNTLNSTQRELDTYKQYYENEKDNSVYWSQAYQELQNSYNELKASYDALFDSSEGYINMAQLPNLFNAFANAVVGVMTPILNIRIGGFTLGSVLGFVLTLLVAVVVVRFLI